MVIEGKLVVKEGETLIKVGDDKLSSDERIALLEQEVELSKQMLLTRTPIEYIQEQGSSELDITQKKGREYYWVTTLIKSLEQG
ncbi:hypothetical protein BEH_17565 [Priestia filamentosa]|uniref:Uncharacterized protein n=1 Tax=Priestia filamentosa TaxID=1402861 RepID=A0A0H4KN28_9BACI|nr:hypothetical protein [Priestia filamentosa]AKO93719.1 hypothetical protein BEH_17565 [Priestia filamentosa]